MPEGRKYGIYETIKKKLKFLPHPDDKIYESKNRKKGVHDETGDFLGSCGFSGNLCGRWNFLGDPVILT